MIYSDFYLYFAGEGQEEAAAMLLAVWWILQNASGRGDIQSSLTLEVLSGLMDARPRLVLRLKKTVYWWNSPCSGNR